MGALNALGSGVDSCAAISQGSMSSSESGRPLKMRCRPCWDACLENIGSLLLLLNNYIRAAEECQQGGGTLLPSSSLCSFPSLLLAEGRY